MALDYLDSIIDLAATEAAVADGRPLGWIARHHGEQLTRIAAAQQTAGWMNGNGRNCWTDDELAFLEANAGLLSDSEIAAALGRSRDAVDVKRGRLGLPAPLSHQDFITANEAATRLGTDRKQIGHLIQTGRLPAGQAPTNEGFYYRIKLSDFYRWCANPMNWPYILPVIRNTERISDERPRRLIERRKERWGDEWWMPADVAAYHNVEPSRVNRLIRAGKISGIRFGAWIVRRSDAIALRLYNGKGGGHFELFGTPAGDAFLLLALAVGHSYGAVEQMTKRGNAPSRLWTIIRKGHVPQLNRAFGMDVRFRVGVPTGQYKLKGAAVYADWQRYAHRFPKLAAACRHFADALARDALEALSFDEWNLVCGALHSAARWRFGSDDPLVKRLVYRPHVGNGRPSEPVAREVWARLGGSWDAAAQAEDGEKNE